MCTILHAAHDFPTLSLIGGLWLSACCFLRAQLSPKEKSSSSAASSKQVQPQTLIDPPEYNNETEGLIPKEKKEEDVEEKPLFEGCGCLTGYCGCLTLQKPNKESAVARYTTVFVQNVVLMWAVFSVLLYISCKTHTPEPYSDHEFIHLFLQFTLGRFTYAIACARIFSTQSLSTQLEILQVLLLAVPLLYFSVLYTYSQRYLYEEAMVVKFAKKALKGTPGAFFLAFYSVPWAFWMSARVLERVETTVRGESQKNENGKEKIKVKDPQMILHIPSPSITARITIRSFFVWLPVVLMAALTRFAQSEKVEGMKQWMGFPFCGWSTLFVPLMILTHPDILDHNVVNHVFISTWLLFIYASRHLDSLRGEWDIFIRTGVGDGLERRLGIVLCILVGVAVAVDFVSLCLSKRGELCSRRRRLNWVGIVAGAVEFGFCVWFLWDCRWIQSLEGKAS
uniref:Uncharacterized protein n=1 Tax=Chromera velia CCMP2878 TaxID=1169474 RepID=A0A0G4FQN0_9ALVE|eukprot:Cvel_18249.t1-p1 / transcript=Cvel_18249.t1 / gene=Cvel_18249 / organism=Chromera_velia_CCMP2878 / gene_product=hypothetical protein / transcript_product=hypothetical protein / location=Cvel_scaffold1501:24871-26523(+) / protein_length=451 / sequence_SO=supercontig / SO=protein_coding / is_pseudo=false